MVGKVLIAINDKASNYLCIIIDWENVAMKALFVDVGSGFWIGHARGDMLVDGDNSRIIAPGKGLRFFVIDRETNNFFNLGGIIFFYALKNTYANSRQQFCQRGNKTWFHRVEVTVFSNLDDWLKNFKV